MKKIIKGFIRLQARVRGVIARKNYQKRIRDQAYRDNVAKEILSTEESYVSSIQVCVEVYENPLREMAKNKSGAITEADLKDIFCNLDSILEVNKNLLNELRRR